MTGVRPRRLARTPRRVALQALLCMALTACDTPRGSPDGADQGTRPLAERLAAAAEPDLHLVRIFVRGDSVALEPDRLNARPGDRIRFVLTGGVPESVQLQSYTPAVAADTVPGAALSSLRRAPLLVEPGETYDVSLSELPPGRYVFRATRAAGRLVVDVN